MIKRVITLELLYLAEQFFFCKDNPDRLVTILLATTNTARIRATARKKPERVERKNGA